MWPLATVLEWTGLEHKMDSCKHKKKTFQKTRQRV